MIEFSESNFIEKLLRLKSLIFQFDKSFDAEKENLLNDLSAFHKLKPNTFTQFHQLLMTMMAYPTNKHLHYLTDQALVKLIAQLKSNSTLQNKFSSTGLTNTLIECNFSFEKVKYLTGKFPNQISIHSASSSVDTQKAALKLLLPNVEYSKIHYGEKDFKTRISCFNSSNKLTNLEWLLQLIHQHNSDNKSNAFLYNQLGIFIQWEIASEIDSVSFLRGKNLPVFYHTKPLDKKVSLSEVINKKLPAPVSLAVIDKQRIIDAAKLTLAYLYRETEPFTNANIDDITLFELNNGISIALFGSKIEKRYSLESYIGYLVFKNNIPASYGGGWILGERSQFGINILESFRGGESSLILCELLRVYHQYFGVTKFVVKPYQFGLHNSEAIKTGAFWFYYKFGFRPEDEKLKALALHEENQKQKNPAYKSDVATLKKYIKSNIALTLSETSYPDYDSEMLSQKITAFVNDKFEGNRQKAIANCFKQLSQSIGMDIKKWKQEDVEYAKEVSLLFSLMPDSVNWQKKHKKNIQLFIQLKSAKTELPWIKHLQKFEAFWEMIDKV